MARSRLLTLIGLSISLMAALFSCARAETPEGAEEAVVRSVKVQMLILDGKNLLWKENNPAKTVEVLEKNLHLIDGNKDYLLLLRDAYKKHIVNLLMKNEADQAEKYLNRLRILDPQGADQIQKFPSAGLTKAGSPVAVPLTSKENTNPAAAKFPLAKADAGKDTVRGTIPEESADCFALENAYSAAGKSDGKMSLAQALLQHAETKFNQQNYLEAQKLFDQAYQVDSKILFAAGTADRWAYSKFQGVVEQLNHKQPGKSLAELEGEVKMALALAPNEKVNKLGLDLLGQIAKRQTGEAKVGLVPVKHLGKSAKGWQVAESSHFRIYHNQTKEFAEQVAQVAEQTRAKMTNHWFGPTAKAWREHCDIYLHANGKEYSQKTGVHPQSPGHSRIETDNGSGEVICRQIELRCDNPDLLSAVLPHETTHVVLAGQFGQFQVPRWVDEGVAVLTEPETKINLHLKNLPHLQQQNELFHVSDLIEMKDYPHASRIGAFYAQSVSLVKYLSAKNGPLVFSQFVRDGMAKGFESALYKHYGIQNYNQLQGQWVQYALAGPAQAGGYAQK